MNEGGRKDLMVVLTSDFVELVFQFKKNEEIGTCFSILTILGGPKLFVYHADIPSSPLVNYFRQNLPPGDSFEFHSHQSTEAIGGDK